MENQSLEIAQRIGALLIGRDVRMAIAESVTGGRIQALITSISGASDFFEGGVVAYSLEQKVRLLGIDRTHAETVNCVSAAVSQQMAAGVARLFRTDVGLGITGYAEPDPVHQISIPQAHVAVYKSAAATAEERGVLLSQTLLSADGDRRQVQTALAHKAVALLLATLESME